MSVGTTIQEVSLQEISLQETSLADQLELDIDPVSYGAASRISEYDKTKPFQELNDFSTGAIVQKHVVHDLKLECGEVLEQAELGFCVYTSNPANDLIIVHPALTGTARAAVPSSHSSSQGDGWWGQHIGPGKMLNTDRYTIVVADHLGGNGGTTTGATLKKLGLHKKVTFRDGITLVSRVLEERGLSDQKVHAVVGGSLGGGQATQWMFQDRIQVGKIVEISGSSRANSSAREYFRSVSDLLWQDRSPAEIKERLLRSVSDLRTPPSEGIETVLEDICEDLDTLERRFDPMVALSTARKIGFLRFVTPQFYDEKISSFGGGSEGKAGLKSWMQNQGETFTTRFSADALATLSYMAANFKQTEPADFASHLVSTGTQFIGYHVDGDRLFPLDHEQRYVDEVNRYLPEDRSALFLSIVAHDPYSGHDRFLRPVFGLDARGLQCLIGAYKVATDPRCEPEHVGDPIPNDPHAISTCMPTWQDVVAYETKDKRGSEVSRSIVEEKLRTGYPRFKLHGHVEDLIEKAEKVLLHDLEKEALLVFPTREAAERCVSFMQRRTGREGQRVEEFQKTGIYAAIYDRADNSMAREYWQHAGEIVTSRLAQATLDSKPQRTDTEPYSNLQERISEIRGLRMVDSVRLFPSGMAAAHGALRLAAMFEKTESKGLKARPTLMYGFPYVDNHKLQEKSELGVRAFMRADEQEFDMALSAIRNGEVSAVVTEATRNPTLGVADLKAFADACWDARIPFIIDDTIGEAANIDVLSYADIVYTSLSKRTSGVGTVTGGSLVLSERKIHYDVLKALADNLFTDQMCFQEDLEVILAGAASYQERVTRSNNSALELAKLFHEHPAVEKVYYPYFQDKENYDAIRREKAGYGGVLSVAFKDEAALAPLFYNRVRFNKGPGVCIDDTIICPINLLTHFDELDTFEQKYGFPAFLTRVSVGSNESVEDLKERALQALDSLPY